MSTVVSVWQFVVVVLRRLLRDRVALFFMIVLPVVVIVIIGVTFGSAGDLKIGVLDQSSGSAASTKLVDALDASDGTKVTKFASLGDLRGAVRRGAIGAGVVLPAQFEQAVGRGDATIRLIATERGEDTALVRNVLVSAAATVLAPADAARFAASLTGIDLAHAQTVAAGIAPSVPQVAIDTTDVGRARRQNLSTFSLVAPQELVLFVFINAMASATALVRMRRTGVLRRVLAGPSGTGTIVLGLLAAWVIVSLLQSVLILGVGSLAFGVDWGSPVAAGTLVLVFALVGAGAGLTVGALGGNEDRVGAITPPFGLVLGALGGCMVPLEVFSPTMRAAAHVVPHYWAMTAWQRLIFDGDGIGGIVAPLLVLTAFAVAFLIVAVVTLRRALVRG